MPKTPKACASEQDLATVECAYAVVLDLFDYDWVDQFVGIGYQITSLIGAEFDTAHLSKICHVALIEGSILLNEQICDDLCAIEAGCDPKSSEYVRLCGLEGELPRPTRDGSDMVVDPVPQAKMAERSKPDTEQSADKNLVNSVLAKQ